MMFQQEKFFIPSFWDNEIDILSNQDQEMKNIGIRVNANVCLLSCITIKLINGHRCVIPEIFVFCYVEHDFSEIWVDSQHGGCWWPGANEAPGHQQPTYWYN